MNIALFLLIVIAALAFGARIGWRASQVNTRQHGLIATSDRDVAINDEADMGECR